MPSSSSIPLAPSSTPDDSSDSLLEVPTTLATKLEIPRLPCLHAVPVVEALREQPPFKSESGWGGVPMIEPSHVTPAPLRPTEQFTVPAPISKAPMVFGGVGAF